MRKRAVELNSHQAEGVTEEYRVEREMHGGRESRWAMQGIGLLILTYIFS